MPTLIVPGPAMMPALADAEAFGALLAAGAGELPPAEPLEED